MPSCFVSHLAFVAMVPFCLPTVGNVGSAPHTDVHGVDASFMDRRVSPIEDFYRFANGHWLDSVSIPKSAAEISATAQARARTEDLIWRLIVPTLSDDSSPVGSPEQIVGQFLRSGLDESALERQGSRPIQAELDRIAGIQSRSDVMGEIARLHRWAIPAVFRVGVGFDYYDSRHRMLCLTQGGLTLQSRDPYLSDDSHSANLKRRFQLVVQKTFSLLGDDPTTLEHSSQRVLAIEKRLAEAFVSEPQASSVEHNFHRVRFSDLKSLTPGIDWSRYFYEIGAKESWTVNIEQPAYFKSIGKLIQQVSVRDWKTYLRWRFMDAVSPFLASDFVMQNFELNSALTGQQLQRSRAESVLEEADRCLGSELGQLLEKTGFGINCKPKVLAMVANIRACLHSTISGLDWMSAKTKATALDKLERLRVQVCYPDSWPDTSKLVLEDGSFVQNVLRARDFEFQSRLDNILKPSDPAEWDIRAYAVDARYRPSLNTVLLPAGLLQPPYFDIYADDASNYGSIGIVIGHELMHAFDGRGSKFDADGNLKNWWSPEDTALYKRHQTALSDQFSDYSLPNQLKVDGRLTLEENVADLGGLTIAYGALERLSADRKLPGKDGFSPEQRFFLSFAQLFRSKRRPESQQLLLATDMHTPPEFRVKGVLQNVPEFWKAFHAAPPLSGNTIW